MCVLCPGEAPASTEPAGRRSSCGFTPGFLWQRQGELLSQARPGLLACLLSAWNTPGCLGPVLCSRLSCEPWLLPGTLPQTGRPGAFQLVSKGWGRACLGACRRHLGGRAGNTSRVVDRGGGTGGSGGWLSFYSFQGLGWV